VIAEGNEGKNMTAYSEVTAAIGIDEFMMVNTHSGQAKSELRMTGSVLSVKIDAVSWDQAIARIHHWASRHESRYVCATNVHSVVTAGHDDDFGKVIRSADMVTPDGAPVAWMLRSQGFADQDRIDGPSLMWKYCEHAAQTGESIYLYGGRPETLEILQQRLKMAFPTLVIAGAYSPPFHTPTAEEDEADVARINASGAGTVWVSLGCPKQEHWAAAHRGRVNAVMIGVGAAFNFHAGTATRAPLWMQKNGLEWVHRLCNEPGRLWKRYLVTNTLFLLGAAKQLAFSRVGKDSI
jgi:N-acetylglucosaminyldiphosphoundecaprenol N-acetyl-beta-D-mannosaminyltransferase